MRNVALLSVFFLVSACLVPKKELLYAQAQVVRLQSDSLAFEQRLMTVQGTMGNTQGQLQELLKSYDEVSNQLDNAEATLQVISRELDSLQLRHKDVIVARDVWRIESMHAKKRADRAEFERDSLQVVIHRYKSAINRN